MVCAWPHKPALAGNTRAKANNRGHAMIADERRRRILSIVQQAGTVSTKQLSLMLAVSEMTVRRDLEYLESRSVLTRHFGGASKPEDEERLTTDFSIRLQTEVEEKKRIAAKARQLINEGDVLFLDHSTTCAFLARELADLGNVKVLTYSLRIVEELTRTQVQVICVGGTLHRPNECFIGPLAEEVLSRFHAPKAFLGTQGIDVNLGLSNGDLFEANMKLLMVDRTEQAVLLADHTKFQTKGLYPNVKTSKIHTIVTDAGTAPETIEGYASLGIQVIVAD